MLQSDFMLKEWIGHIVHWPIPYVLEWQRYYLEFELNMEPWFEGFNYVEVLVKKIIYLDWTAQLSLLMSVPVYHWLSLLSMSGVVTTIGTSLDSVGMYILI